MTSLKLTDIVSYGHDRQLSMTRALILQKAGYAIVDADCEESFRSINQNCRPRLVLLCQTLDAEECARCMAVAVTENASVRTLVMFNQTLKCVPPSSGALVRSSAGPMCLLSVVETLIGPGTVGCLSC